MNSETIPVQNNGGFNQSYGNDGSQGAGGSQKVFLFKINWQTDVIFSPKLLRLFVQLVSNKSWRLLLNSRTLHF
jgi:hypothetical protein